MKNMMALGVTLSILNFLMCQQKEAHGQLFQYKDDYDYFKHFFSMVSQALTLFLL